MTAGTLSRRDLLRASAFALQLPNSDTWSWNRWRQITAETPPNLTTLQSGQARLSDLLDPPLASATEWPARRASLRRVIDLFLGAGPAAPPPLEARTDDELTLDGGLTRRRVRFQTEPGEFVPAYVFIPARPSAKNPAVVCPHQTTQFGMDEPAGLRGNPRLAMALALARRGCVTLTYDAACFGSRHNPASGHYGDAVPFYQRHPRWSMMGKMAWDLSRAVDYLRTLDFVDPARIASAGHSHGGYTTWFAMALDERIAAGVSSCGFDTFRHDGNPYRWSHATALLPRLGFYLTSPRINPRNYSGVPDSGTIQIPFDMHWVLALIAPRPLLLTASDDDNIFPNAGWSTRQAEARLRPVYALLNAPDSLQTLYFRGGHGFPPEIEDRAFAFIDRWLRR
ncbi:MAG: prolyl oligopeptidase family serine peptidase [Candidatus Solibacter usitatus]|nr:prolyl oligopeptidase family serine peptidase [Candidatus Solibacter usitatus]